MSRRIIPFILVLLLAAPLGLQATTAATDPNGAQSTSTGDAPQTATVDEETDAHMDPNGVSAPSSAPTPTPGSLSLFDWLRALWSFVVPLT